MSVIYVDTSVILGVYLRQKGCQAYRMALLEADDVISSSLLVSEIAATFKREDVDLAFLQPCIESVSIFYPNDSLIALHRKILSHAYCRGADLHQLACGMHLDPAG